MKYLEKLKETKTLNEFAALLGYQPNTLSYILYKIPPDQKYIKFEIPKKGGGVRKINAPNEKLKKLQSELSKLLFRCTEELLHPTEQQSLIEKRPTRARARRAVAHGFKKGLSILSNSEMHINKRFVFNIDLEKFFPSINFGRVRGYFIKNKNFQLDPKIATIIAQIACYENELPQGSPSSPIISNMVTQILDMRLVKLSKKAKCTYSRYADDITFSTNQKKFPEEIATEKNLIWSAGKKLKECIASSGYKINFQKSRMQYKTSRQVVTGLVVNKAVNVNIDYYRSARSMCNELFRTGEYFLSNENKNPETSLEKLNGILNYIYFVKDYKNKYADEGYRKSRHDGFRKNKSSPFNRMPRYSDESHRVAVDGIKNLYAKFLFFRHFYLLEKPTLFCEGPTDNIYLRCALRSLASQYPTLASTKNNSKLKVNFSINFVNRTKTLTEMLKIADGFSGMKYIALEYDRLIRKYKCSGLQHPVIMIVDNDEGGRQVRKATEKEISIKKITDHLFHLGHNLYLIEIPRISQADTPIEKYFPISVLDTKLAEKQFNMNNTGADNKTSYGKTIFAKSVIQKQQTSIDFSNFKGIFDLVCKATDDYKTILTTSVKE